jgi:hypothetical protein
MHHSTVISTEQKINLIFSDFFSEFSPKKTNRVKIKDKLTFSEKKEFAQLISDNSNFKLLNIMSNICYKKINKDQKGLGVFMDVLFKSCEK